MKRVVLSVILIGCADIQSEPAAVAEQSIGDDTVCPVNCDPATPPQCMSLTEAAPLATSPNFAPWFTADICPTALDIGGAWVDLVPWFCDSTQWFPEACMPTFGKTPTVALNVACCHPAGVQLMNACHTDADCPQPHSECFERFCAQTNVCAISAKTEGTVCTAGACTTDPAELCPYSGPPPLCGY